MNVYKKTNMSSYSVPPVSEETPHIVNLSDKQVKFVFDPRVIDVVQLSDVVEVVTDTDLSQYGFVKVDKHTWKNKRFLKGDDSI